MEVAIHLLSLHIYDMRSVSDWATKMGWERSEFSRKFKRYYGESAKECFHRIKMKTIENHFSAQPDAKYYEVACDLGFRDEKALYDYVRYHKKCSPTSYKNQVIGETAEVLE